MDMPPTSMVMAVATMIMIVMSIIFAAGLIITMGYMLVIMICQMALLLALEIIVAFDDRKIKRTRPKKLRALHLIPPSRAQTCFHSSVETASRPGLSPPIGARLRCLSSSNLGRAR